MNFFPGKTRSEVEEMFKTRWHKRPNQTLEKSMYGLFPNKIPSALLKVIGLDKNTLVKNINEKDSNLLFDKLTNFIVDINATRGWNEAEFTAGGVDTNFVKIATLESKLVDNLYFCGEILDVDGDVGGFNLSWAWSSGFASGKLKE